MSDDIILEDVELDLLDDKETFEEELSRGADYFRLEEGVTYKVELTSTKVKKVNKKFLRENGDEDIVVKYVLEIKAKGSDKSEFVGTWEVGRSVLTPIFKNYDKDAVFNVSRTGKGMDTRYSVNKDF